MPNYLKILLLGLSLLMVVCSTSAQERLISGILKHSENSETLIGAKVILSANADVAPVKQEASDEQGRFEFRVVPGEYLLKISYIGFEELERTLEVSGEDINLGVLKMRESTALLQDVEIEAVMERAEQIGDTTQFNANAYKVNTDASAENLLEKMPGISMENGRMKSQGEDIQQVLVDGKPFFGNDPNAAIKNIPAEMIDKVQVFDQQSQQAQFTGFDDGETRKTVNIVTKPEFRIGTFGRIYAGAGAEGEYKAGGVVNSFKDTKRLSVMAQLNNINSQNFAAEDLSGVAGANTSSQGGRGRGRRGGGGSQAGADVGDFLVDEQGGITETQALGINYTDKWGEKTELTASYFFNRTSNNNVSNLFRQLILPGDSGQVYSEQNRSSTRNMNHRFNLRLKQSFNERNTLVIQPSLSYQMSDGSQVLKGESVERDIFLNRTDNQFNTELTAFNFLNELDFMHKFQKEGRTVTLGLSQRVTSNQGENNLQAINTYLDETVNDTLDQLSNLDLFDQYHRLSLYYTEPLSENVQLMINYRPSIALGNVEKRTFNYFSEEEGYSRVDTLLSSVFESSYVVQEGGPGIRYNKGRSINLMARVYYQNSTLESDQFFPGELQISRVFNAFLPMFRARFSFKNKSNLFVFYRGSTDAPSVSQLQEVVDNSNPLNLSSGNAALDQSNGHTIYSRYSATNKLKGTVFSAYFRSSFTNSFIGTSTLIARENLVLDNGLILQRGGRFNQPVNLNGNYSHRGSVSYGLPVKLLKSNLNFEIGGSYNRTPSLINDEVNIAYSPDVFSSLSLSSSFSQKFDFTVSTRPSLTFVENSLTPESNSRFLSLNTKLRLYWNFYEDLIFRSDLSNQVFEGLSGGFNQNFTLLSLSLGYKFLPEKQAELNLSVFDALGQNNSISRTVSETSIDDLQTVVLERYFMLNFIWTIKDFGKGKKES